MVDSIFSEVKNVPNFLVDAWLKWVPCKIKNSSQNAIKIIFKVFSKILFKDVPTKMAYLIKNSEFWPRMGVFPISIAHGFVNPIILRSFLFDYIT